MIKRLRYLLAVAKNLVRPEPTWQIYLGDCVAGMHRLDPQSVDVVVTSPPYNLGKEYNTYDDNKDADKYLDWCEDWATQIARVSRSYSSKPSTSASVLTYLPTLCSSTRSVTFPARNIPGAS